MSRLKNCIVWGYMSKGGGKRFYLASNPTHNSPYTDDLDLAKTMPYDVASSIAKPLHLFVESR